MLVAPQRKDTSPGQFDLNLRLLEAARFCRMENIQLAQEIPPKFYPLQQQPLPRANAHARTGSYKIQRRFVPFSHLFTLRPEGMRKVYRAVNCNEHLTGQRLIRLPELLVGV
jgi:hypothetical protein